MYNGYTVIDAHAHIFPDKIAGKATDGISEFYDIPMSHQGNVHELFASGDKVGIDGYLVCSAATHPSQTKAINHYIELVCKQYPQCIGFATIHPYSESMLSEMEKILKLPFKGIKLHPDFQQFDIDDKKVYSLYEMIEDSGLPILMHMGDPNKTHSLPRRLVKVLDDFPRLKVIAAHLGGYQRWNEAIEVLKPSERLKFDTSSSLSFMPPEKAVDFIRKYGVENCFFGVDFPMWDHKEELDRFFKLDLTDTENKKILSENFIEWIRKG